MRYTASEKLDIIRLVEKSHLSVRRTLAETGVARAMFYRWYDRYQTGGPEALKARSPKPDRVWNRIPDDVRERIVQLALTDTLERCCRPRGWRRRMSRAGPGCCRTMGRATSSATWQHGSTTETCSTPAVHRTIQ